METINLSEIKNFQNDVYNQCVGIGSAFIILHNILKKKGRKPIYYYNGKKIIIDIQKEEVEEIEYCGSCGYQELKSKINNKSEICPSCGCDFEWYTAYRIKGRQLDVYSDEQYKKLPDNFKNKFIHLKRFNYLRQGRD